MRNVRIVNIKRREPREIYRSPKGRVRQFSKAVTYATLVEAETGETLIHATLEYIQEQIANSARGYTLVA